MIQNQLSKCRNFLDQIKLSKVPIDVYDDLMRLENQIEISKRLMRKCLKSKNCV